MSRSVFVVCKKLAGGSDAHKHTLKPDAIDYTGIRMVEKPSGVWRAGLILG